MVTHTKHKKHTETHTHNNIKTKQHNNRIIGQADQQKGVEF